MSIVIDGDDTFKTEVIDALDHICPCSTYVADGGGVVSEVSDGSCGCYCRHLAGCNLVTAILEDNGKAVTIIDAGDFSAADFKAGLPTNYSAYSPARELYWSST